ncbi:hypothetical protein TVAG_419680 [Trichomonas vaginalis G3]|uniref:Chorein N-terminal domain-containing protein n=1 Tax=Trichomonas vaginalis (strain ATCC PRA-98 / G3) TaxID=412133 RepID=A2EIU2_TRIV3|nr:regulation of parkin-mediated stimulation of mitophagy in response to mitochondrial depolarization [Trichomonas vaginalis G3]EAY07426.1 hypothetical protein TVAG_419680 [Trichomonas vaginalis G3]KAI5484635.1 regulation of parkin-mediated stimulation of mitophagy in response to mitochondrial depolarization [Trichomonas vaginalis G3]|eukprot:XP_001319649.1 hypothetical protein [Trichomonas vaginalis G3]
MSADLLCEWINSSLSSYLEDISRDQTNFSLFKGKLELSHVQLYKYALLQHNLPLVIDQGVISSMVVNMPLKNLVDVNATVKIDEITIICHPLILTKEKYPPKEDIPKIRDHQMNAHDYFKKTFNSLISKSSIKFYQNIIRSFVKNVKISINNVHIRIEIPRHRSVNVLGVKIKNIEINDPPTNTRPNSIVRAIEINGFSVYYQRKKKKISLHNIKRMQHKMQKVFKSEQEYLIEPMSLTGTVQINDAIDKFDIDVQLPDLKINVNRWILRLLHKILDDYPKFFLFWRCRWIPRPNFDKIEEAWKFVNTCALKSHTSTRNQTTNTRELCMNFFKYRRAVLKKNTQEITKLEQTLPTRLALLYRDLFQGKLKSAKQYEEVLTKVEADMQLLLSNLIRMISIKATNESCAIRLKHDTEQKFLEIIVKNGSISNVYKNHSFILQALYNEIQIYNVLDKNNRRMLLRTLDENRVTFIATLKVLDTFDIDTKSKSTIDIELNASNYKVNLDAINYKQFDPIILHYLKDLSKILGSKYLPINWNNLALRFCPAKMDLRISEDISAILSWKVIAMIKKSFTLKDACITVNCQGYVWEVIKNVSLNGTFTHLKLPIEITPFSFKFEWDKIRTIVYLVKSFDWVVDFLKVMLPYLPKIIPKYKFEFTLPYLTMSTYYRDKYVYDITLKEIMGRLMTKQCLIHLFTKSLTITENLKVTKIAISIDKDFHSTLSAELVNIKFFNLFNLMPKKFFDGYSMTCGLPTLDLFVNNLIIDFSYQKTSVIYSCCMMKGQLADDKIKFSGCSQFYVNKIDFLNNAELNEGYLFFEKKVNLIMNFEKIIPNLNNVLVNDFLTWYQPMSLFPETIQFNIVFNIKNMIAFDDFYLSDVCLDVRIAENVFKCLLSLSKIEMPYVVVKNGPNDINLELDLFNRKFGATLLNLESFVDPSKFIKIINQIANLEFIIPSDITAGCQLDNFILHLRLPENEITCQFSMTGSISFEKFEVTSTVKNILVSLDRQDIIQIPIAEVYTDKNITCFSKDVFVNFSLWQLLRLVQLATEDLLPTIKIPNIKFNDFGRKLGIKVDSTQVSLRTQSSTSFGPFSLLMTLKEMEIDIYNFAVSTAFDIITALSPFEHMDSISGKFEGNLDLLNKIINVELLDGLKCIVSPLHIASFVSLLDTTHIAPPFLRITNNTTIDMMINGKFYVKKNATYFQRSCEFIDKIDIRTDDDRALSVDVRSLSNVYKAFDFSGKLGGSIALCIENSTLKISSRYRLKNNTSNTIRYLLLGTNICQILSNNISFLPPECKLDSISMQTIALKKKVKKTGDVTTIIYNSKLYPIIDPCKSKRQVTFHLVSPPPVSKRINFTGKINCNLGKTELVVNDSYMHEICRVLTSLSLDVVAKNGLMTVNVCVDNFDIIARKNHRVINTMSSPILELNASLCEPPTIDEIDIVIGDCSVSLDVSILEIIFREFWSHNTFLTDINERSRARTVKMQINTPIIEKSRSPLSKIMLQNSYVTFTPEMSVDIIELIEFFAIKHLKIAAGKLSVKCVNKRDTVMHPLLSMIPSFGKLSVDLKGKPLIETNNIWNPFEKTDFMMFKPLVLQFLLNSECFGSIMKSIKKVGLQNKNLSTYKKCIGYIKVGIYILHSLLYYISSSGHSICGQEPLPDNPEPFEMVNWYVTTTVTSVITAFTMIKTAVKEFPSKFVDSIIMFLISLCQVSLAAPDLILILIEFLLRFL